MTEPACLWLAVLWSIRMGGMAIDASVDLFW